MSRDGEIAEVVHRPDFPLAALGNRSLLDAQSGLASGTWDQTTRIEGPGGSGTNRRVSVGGSAGLAVATGTGLPGLGLAVVGLIQGPDVHARPPGGQTPTRFDDG